MLEYFYLNHTRDSNRDFLSGLESTLGIIALKGNSTFPKALGLEPHHQTVYCYIQDICPRGLLPQLRCSRCVLLTLPTWLLCVYMCMSVCVHPHHILFIINSIIHVWECICVYMGLCMCVCTCVHPHQILFTFNKYTMCVYVFVCMRMYVCVRERVWILVCQSSSDTLHNEFIDIQCLYVHISVYVCVCMSVSVHLHLILIKMN